MNKNDLIEFLPRIHNLSNKSNRKGQNGFSKYQILKVIGLDPSKQNYRKVDECIDIGFLKQVNDNPPEFVPDRDKIWEFWKGTPSGDECKRMIDHHAIIFE